MQGGNAAREGWWCGGEGGGGAPFEAGGRRAGDKAGVGAEAQAPWGRQDTSWRPCCSPKGPARAEAIRRGRQQAAEGERQGAAAGRQNPRPRACLGSPPPASTAHGMLLAPSGRAGTHLCAANADAQQRGGRALRQPDAGGDCMDASADEGVQGAGEEVEGAAGERRGWLPHGSRALLRRLSLGTVHCAQSGARGEERGPSSLHESACAVSGRPVSVAAAALPPCPNVLLSVLKPGKHGPHVQEQQPAPAVGAVRPHPAGAAAAGGGGGAAPRPAGGPLLAPHPALARGPAGRASDGQGAGSVPGTAAGELGQPLGAASLPLSAAWEGARGVGSRRQAAAAADSGVKGRLPRSCTQGDRHAGRSTDVLSCSLLHHRASPRTHSHHVHAGRRIRRRRRSAPAAEPRRRAAPAVGRRCAESSSPSLRDGEAGQLALRCVQHQRAASGRAPLEPAPHHGPATASVNKRAATTLTTPFPLLPNHHPSPHTHDCRCIAPGEGRQRAGAGHAAACRR